MSVISDRRAQQTLSDQLQARDHRAFCDLYDSTVSYVYNLARCVADDPAWAECVTEAVFASVWRSPADIGPACGTVHEALATLVYRLSSVAGADVAVVAANRPQRARVALSSLTPGESAALNAVYFGGQSMSAAATALGSSVIDVARDLRQALVHLNAAQSSSSSSGEAAPDVA